MKLCLQGAAQASGFDHCWLLDECTLVLQTQSKASKPDQAYMAGALAGLSSALAQCQVLGTHLPFPWHLCPMSHCKMQCHKLGLHLALM